MATAQRGEALLIARLKLERLITESRWDEAAAVGTHALRGAGAVAADPTHQGTRIAILVAGLGLLVDANLISRFLCAVHTADGAPPPPQLLREATESLKRLRGHDVDTWARGILGVGAPTLETLDAAIEQLDTSTCAVIVAHHGFHSAIQHAICSPDATRRAAALHVLTTAMLTAPSLAVPLLPIVRRAVYVEDAALKHIALAGLLDVAFALAQLPAPAEEPASGEQQLLESLMQWLPHMLHAPTLGLQTLAALGLSRLVLHRHDQSLLLVCTDPEQIIVTLTRRYTACGVGPAAASSAPADHAAHPLPILLAFFEELKAKRQDDLGNTIAWLVLDALEATARLDEIDGDVHRAARFLFSLVDEASVDVVLSAVCLNVQRELGVPLTNAEVASWLGKAAC